MSFDNTHHYTDTLIILVNRKGNITQLEQEVTKQNRKRCDTG